MRTTTASEMPLAHVGLVLGLLILGLLCGCTLVPLLLNWPFYLLIPLIVYLLIAVSVPLFRQSLTWLRWGRLDGVVWMWTAAIVITSSAALVIWHEWTEPDLSKLVAFVPPWPLPWLVAAGVVFSVLNALLEEVLFRGLMFDALRTSYGVTATLLIQATAFGVLHFGGFPSGTIGVVLASVYGLIQGACASTPEGSPLAVWPTSWRTPPSSRCCCATSINDQDYFSTASAKARLYPLQSLMPNSFWPYSMTSNGQMIDT